MTEFIFSVIYRVADVHEKLLSINDSGGYYFNDKQLHFIVMGVLGLLGIFVIYPIFKLLADSGHTMVIAWLYVFTVMIVLTFAIEIGQWYTGTGKLDFRDMTSGLAGFLVMFAIFAVIRGIFHFLVRLFSRD